MNAERGNYYQNLDNLTPWDYYRIWKMKDTRTMMKIAFRMGSGTGRGIISAGINTQRKVSEEGGKVLKEALA